MGDNWDCIPTIEATIQDLLNFSQQFNYDKDKIVEITKENEYIYEQQNKEDDKRQKTFEKNVNNLIIEANPNEQQHSNEKLDHEKYEKYFNEKEHSIYKEYDTQIEHGNMAKNKNDDVLCCKNSNNNEPLLKNEKHVENEENSDVEIQELAQIYRLLSPTPFTNKNKLSPMLHTSKNYLHSDDETLCLNLSNARPHFHSAREPSANNNDETNQECDYAKITSNQNSDEISENYRNHNENYSNYEADNGKKNDNTFNINSSIYIKDRPTTLARQSPIDCSHFTNAANRAEDLFTKQMNDDENNEFNDLIYFSPNKELCDSLPNINSPFSECSAETSGIKKI
jgi:hypothetical protein